MDNKDNFASKISDVVKDFIAQDEVYGDNAQLSVVPETLELEIVGGDVDDPEKDYYDLMDLVEMTPEGKWIPDVDAISEVAGNYTI